MAFSEYLCCRPDTAQWVDLRGFLFSGRCDIYGDPGEFIVRPWEIPAAFAAGQPSPECVERAVLGTDASEGAWAEGDSENEWHLLAPPESVEAIARVFDGWKRRDVTLHMLESGVAPVPSSLDIRIAAGGWDEAGWKLDHLPSPIRREYESELVRSRPIAAAFDEDIPVSFCYSAVNTETLWDVAVDTLESHRRRGLSGACFSALAHCLANDGMRPVWGALNENEPSMRLAAKLGFRRVAGLVSFLRPDP